jgi:adenine-specific DNA-methyltransferase
MPTLNWIGKEKVVSHHQDVPYRVLEHKYGFTPEKGEQTVPTNSGNKIIHGDNLEALKSLLPEYEGKVKCIYIDPPYNTGNEGWTYNDNVNHPKIKKWLDETLKAKEQDKVAAIGVDDLTRHDKWLCMMYPRLKLLQRLISDDGVIFISINFPDEHAHLKCICNEIFGENNYLGDITWESTTQPINSGTARFNLQQKTEPILL